MKNFFLSFFVIGAFVIYSLYQKGKEDRVKVFAPKQTNSQVTSIPSQILGNATPTLTELKQTSGSYIDGKYRGSVADAFYGNVQVEVTISGGKITDVQFLQYPSDRETSIEINNQAMPVLKQETITTQNAHVDVVSGATQSSQAFLESLQSALNKAKS